VEAEEEGEAVVSVAATSPKISQEQEKLFFWSFFVLCVVSYPQNSVSEFFFHFILNVI
jgi:hypothetical protein